MITSGTVEAGQTLEVSAMDDSVIYNVIEGTTYNAEDILAQGDRNPDTTDWFPYVHSGVTNNTLDIKGSVLDVSSVLPKEKAGDHGYINVVGDKFVFEDGTEARFWGTDICGSACFPSYAFAPILADAIAASGFNLVRFHHMDNPGKLPNIFGATKDSGPNLSIAQMDKLCYFIKQLKDRGIYYYMDQTVYRKVYDADGIPSTGVEPGLKGPTYYDEDVIALQNEYSRQLMTWKNTRTGYTIGTDPALVMVDLANENSLVGTDKINIDNGGRYYTELKAMFNEWLKKKYKNDKELIDAWNTNPDERKRYGLCQGEPRFHYRKESLTDNSVEVERYFERRDWCTDGRNKDTTQFLMEIQEKYFNDRAAYMRELGVRCPITGCTVWSQYGNESMYAMLASNRGTDFIDSHHYLNHPSGGWHLEPGTTSQAISSILDDQNLGFFGKAANLTAYGKPRVISEWNICDPTPSISEGILIMSAMGAMQGWHPIMFQYTETEKLNSERYGNNQVYIEDFMSMDSHPARKAMAAAAAIAFRRGDVTEADSGYFIAHGTDYSAVGAQTIPDSAALAMTGKTGVIIGDESGADAKYLDQSVKQKAESAASGDNVFRSVTDELVFDLKNGAFSLNTPRTQAITGYKSGYTAASAELSDIDVQIDNRYATVVVNSLDGKPIAESGSMLLTTVGQVWNSGQVMRRDGTGFLKTGTYPVLCEPICGSVTIKTAGDFDVYILDSSGRRGEKASTVKTAEGYTKILLTKDNATMNYEIVGTEAGM